MKISNYPIRNRTHNLLSYSAKTRPNTPPWVRVYGSEHSNVHPLASSLQRPQSHSNNDITNHPLVKQEFYQLETSVRDTVQDSSGLDTADIQIRPE